MVETIPKSKSQEFSQDLLFMENYASCFTSLQTGYSQNPLGINWFVISNKPDATTSFQSVALIL
jgi:hypothetical protein